MLKKSFILFSCILTGFGTQEAHAYQNPEETRGRCTYIDTARQYLENAKNLIDNELYNSATTVLKEGIAAYQRCVEPDDSNFQTLSSLYYNLGFAYYHVSDYEHSLAYFYKIVKLQGTNPRMQAKAYIGISNVFNSLKNPQESIHALKRARRINQSLQDRDIEIGVLNNLANAHAINGEYDSVLYCLQHAYEYSFLLADTTGKQVSILLNMANALQALSRWEESEYCYRKALDEARKLHNHYLCNQVEYGLALVLLNQGQDQAGLELLEKCLEEASILDHKRLESLAHQRLSRFCMEHGNYKEAYNHLAMKQSLDDSIFNIESERNINRLKADFDIYQIETSKQLLERDLAIYKNKIFRRNLNIAILALLAVAALGIALFIARKLIRRNREYNQLNNRLDSLKEHIDSEKQKLNERFRSELELKHKELTTNALLLVKSEEIAGDILENVKRLQSPVSKAENDKRLREIESLAQELYAGKGWEEFKYSFEQVNSAFYKNLNEKYPGLTASDQRFAALLSLGLTTKEIAIMTNRSVRGVETSKFRLKKKMGLDVSENLIEVLMNLK